MKNTFFSFLFFGFFLATIISFADPQDSSRKSGRRHKTPAHRHNDTAATRMIDHGTKVPALQKTDSLPIPQPDPVPQIPRPDTMKGKIMN